MEYDIIKTVATQGVFAALFVGLLIYVLKQNERRELRLIDCLDKLSICYGEIKKDVDEIKGWLTHKK